MRHFLFFLFLTPGVAQLADTGAYLHYDFSAGFRYELKLGTNSYPLGSAPGYGLKYSYRPLRWLAFEAGLEQIPRPVGASVCCEYLNNANDELYLVPFGARYVWEPQHRRLRISAGGGGAYMKHTFGHESPTGGLVGASAWGAQFVASGDYPITHSGHFRAGVTARYYYLRPSSYTTARIFTIGPDFTFSF
jgi:hypothetical protein